MARNINIKVGLTRVSKPLYPSEPGYVAQMQQQVKQLTDAIQDVFNQLEDVSEDIMLMALEPTLEKARDVYCPVLTGALRESAYLEPTGTREKPRVEIGFAYGGNPRYAVYVHEMTEVNHKPPTQAKFLQRAVLEDLPGIFERIAHGYQEFMNVGI